MSETLIFPTHSCFDDALDLAEALVMQDRREAGKLFVVHAICLMPDGRPYAHAWLEREDCCLFVGVIEGREVPLEAAKDEFYVEYKVQESTRYTLREALAENVRTNHYGPWKPEYEALCGKNCERTSYLLTEKDGRPGILCKACGLTSYHPKDVEERYCGNCHRFLTDDPD